MKLSAALLSILLSSVSFAAQNQPPTPVPGQQQPGRATQVPVFEKARVKVSMFKRTIERVGDTYQEHREDICTKQLVIEVPDTRAYDGPPSQLPVITCDAPNHEPFELKVWFYSLVERHANSDIKTYWSNMSAAGTQTGQAPKIILPGFNLAGTRQLDLKSMIFSLVAPQGVFCAKSGTSSGGVKRALPLTVSDDDCEILNPVTYGAFVEFESL